MTTPDLSKLTVAGPFWSAEVEVVQLDAPQPNLALRRLFLDTTARKVAGTNNVLAPGTLLVLCLARRVLVAPAAGANATYEWQRPQNAPAVPLASFDQMRAAIRSGAASLLLLEADPTAWPAASGKPPTLTCLAGDIALDQLQAQKDAVKRLYDALTIQQPDPANLRPPGKLAVHASGLSILGTIALPWQSERVSALFQLARVSAPPGTDAPAFRLTIEGERLTVGERQQLTAAAQLLSGMLNPRYPLNLPPRPTAASPRWATLELVNPTVPPRIFWPLPAWGTLGQLAFERGEVNLLFSDRPPYDSDRPPSSLARIVPALVTISGASGTLEVAVTAGSAPSPADEALVYTYQSGGDEQLSLHNIVTAFSPTETPELLRVAQDLPVPEWDASEPAPLAQPVVWGFAPLDIGWVQLPIPNLTEQIYLDAGLAQLDSVQIANAEVDTASALVQGAVSFTNLLASGAVTDSAEHPWNITLTDVAGLRGTWTLTTTNGSLALTAIRLAAAQPRLALNGFLWLSADRPTAADALPSFDNWLTGLRSIPLEQVRTRVVEGRVVAADLFPALVVLRLQQLGLRVPRLAELPSDPDTPAPDALLERWQVSFEVDNPALALRRQGAPTSFTTLVERLFGASPVLPADIFSHPEPLLWRRHPTLPAIQVLPLTQTKSPPNEPIAGRQLAPFALPTHQPAGMSLVVPDSWVFGVSPGSTGPASGAASWPQWTHLANSAPAVEWRRLPDLPLAVLSLPGLQLDPSAHAATSGLHDMVSLQYRYDLPYTDEIQALAQMPKERRRPDEVSPLPDEPAPQPPKPLTRETYAAHWQRLSEQASLAALDAAAAFNHEDGQTVVRGLIEPLTWPVAPSVDLESYPGTLTIADATSNGSAPMELRGDQAAPDAAGNQTPGASNAALRGISGQFFAQGDGTVSRKVAGASPFQIEAGSMAMHRQSDGQFRDQRGLSRAATGKSSGLLTTSVQLDEPAHTSDTVVLTSTLVAQELLIEPGQVWRLWFRDLPLRNDLFSRANTVSPAAQDVNDPEALGREFNYLNGYEWRLADSDPLAGDSPVMRLCGLEFFPLKLDQLQLENDQVKSVELIGRLQLPLSSKPTEIADLGNAVRVSFVRSSAGLALAGVTMVSAVGEWPLALENGELIEAPRIVWNGVRYDPAARAIELISARLCCYLFDVEWRIALAAGTARFTAGSSSVAPALEIPAADGALTLVDGLLQLTLKATAPAGDEPIALAHTVALDIAVRLGRALAAPNTQGRTAFTATLRFSILPSGVAAAISSAALFDDIVLCDATSTDSIGLSVRERALEFAWDAWQSAPPGLQILPGALLDGGAAPGNAAPGCAALTFDTSIPEPGATSQIPTLSLRVAFVEAVLQARWGAFLQTDTAPTGDLRQHVYGSSAGDLSLGYTAHALQQPGGLAWDEGFLLNGFIEITNLISWPADMRFDPARSTLTLPPARVDNAPGPLDHVRHTMRVLLNQHAIPQQQLALAEGSALLFNLTSDRPWQTLAVVEHQLIDVRETLQAGGEPALRLQADRRWTATQELRLMAPAVLRSFLEQIGNPALRSLDPVVGLAPLSAGGEGYFAPALRMALLAEIDRLDPQTPFLFVEASAPHWLCREPLGEEVQPTTLQYLPGGSQHAILSGLDDFAPAAPLTPNSEWLLSTTPFLGRLQLPGTDGLDQAAAQAPAGPLVVDPVLALRRALDQPARPPYTALAFALAHRGDLGAIEVRIALLDTAAGHTWARLDPLMLAEHWFRLQTPFPEPMPERIPSVIAALPDTPARASRSVALRRAFDVFRPFVPPTDIGAFRLPGNNTFRYQLPPELDSAELVWRQHSLLAPSSIRQVRAKTAPFITNGLQALYTFAEGSGALVGNHASADPSLNLTIREPNNVAWVFEGLAVQTQTVIHSPTAVQTLVETFRASNAISVEVWFVPAARTPLQLARMLSIANDAVRRNFELLEEREDEQRSVRYSVRLRTSKTPGNADPPLQTPKLTRASTPQHIVYTRDTTGLARIYVNGTEQVRGTMDGDLSSWDASYHLSLANTFSADRPWLGTYQSVALYSRALTPDEVQQSYSGLAAPLAGAWYNTAALLCSSNLAGADSDQTASIRRYPAATLLPARLKVDLAQDGVSVSAPNPQPLGFALSPYLGMSFRHRPAQTQRALVVAELVCIDPVTGQFRPTATRFFEDQAASEQATGDWARELHSLLAPESPVALLRLREIAAQPQDQQAAADTATIVIGYRFALVDNIALPDKLSQRVTRLRAAPNDLTFREGQYGGNSLPEAIEAFELAPPQTIGAQPIYLTERPNPPTPPADQPVAWPWGLAALRLSVRYTKAGRGVAGAASGAATLWWQAIQYGLQYRSALRRTPLFALPPAVVLQEGPATPGLLAAFATRQVPLAAGSSVIHEPTNDEWRLDDRTHNLRYIVSDPAHTRRVSRLDAAAAGLPALFRAPAIRSFLPVLPDPRLPAQNGEQASAATAWQPVLPGSLRYLVLGARSGAMLALRNQLIRQRNGVLVSGSLPTQQRMPRPVPLPLNRAAASDVALQTWASFFEPERNLLVSPDPIDETFYAATATHAAQRLRLRLISPARGTLPADWDGTLIFETALGDNPNPEPSVSLLASATSFTYQAPTSLKLPLPSDPPAPAPLPPEQTWYQLTYTPSQNDALKRQLTALGPGAQVLVQAKVEPADTFQQTLTFPLRLSDPNSPLLPLEPHSIHFEDPEYNRALATQAGRAERLIKLTKPNSNEFGLFTITLTSDRRTYNAFSPLALRYDWDNSALSQTKLRIVLERVTTKGVTEVLLESDDLKPATLWQIGLAELRSNQSPGIFGAAGDQLALLPDDKLRIKLLAGPNTTGWTPYQRPPISPTHTLLAQLEVDIVAEPVIPVPEAAYALLRRQTLGGQAQVECVRFAWGPNASRIELISKDDLPLGVVRRRAVFQWRDIVRTGALEGYAVQKIANNGATHVPMEWEK